MLVLVAGPGGCGVTSVTAARCVLGADGQMPWALRTGCSVGISALDRLKTKRVINSVESISVLEVIRKMLVLSYKLN